MCGCGKESKENIIKDLKNSINNAKSYKTIGTMEISNDEEVFTYSIESYYLKNDYYKVILVNQTNNHEQIILKNKDEIYVITPALNKSFKFQSEWPNNSSQAYLLDSIINDINSDKELELNSGDNGYVIKVKVNYPNNNELKYEKIYLNNKKEIEKVEVYNNNDILKIKATFEDIDLNAKLKEEDFKIDNYVKEEEPPKENEDNKCAENEECPDKEKKTANIDNIIYPLYIPSNTFLTSSEKIEMGEKNRIILTFSGDKNFVLIEEPVVGNNVMEIIPVYGEPLMLSETIGALSANSLSWSTNNISYYLASTELSVNEMQLIANSLGNNTLASKTK
jgi:outer membrane lipoprotein-sorting protein